MKSSREVMRRSWIVRLTGTVLFASCVAGATEPSLIPWPAEVASVPGVLTVDGKTPICATGVAGEVAQRLQTTIKAVQGLDLKTRRCGRAGIALVLSSDTSVADTEGYTLDVGANGIRIAARAEAGLYYGAMTAVQLLSAGAAQGSSVRLAGMHIEDFPRSSRWVSTNSMCCICI
jgi:hexosaminidase